MLVDKYNITIAFYCKCNHSLGYKIVECTYELYILVEYIVD